MKHVKTIKLCGIDFVATFRVVNLTEYVT